MKCYRHHDRDAIGVCKSCNKGLCSDCAADIGNGIACKNSCEQAVRDLNEIISKSKSVYQKNSSTYYRMAVIYGLIGLFFIIYSFINTFLASFLLPLCVIFLIGAIFMFYSGLVLNRKKESDS
jgi:hypothetical protein